MSEWRVELRKSAEDDLAKLDKPIQRRIIEKLTWLQENFEDVSSLRLNWEYDDLQKLRVGDWRVVYKVNWEKSVLVVYYINHRSKIYKRKR